MSSQKKTGSYYTPIFLSSFIIRYIAKNVSKKKHVSILEPSIGDGSFVHAFNNTKFPVTAETFSFTGVDLVINELIKAEAVSLDMKKANCDYKFFNDDFLRYQETITKKFSLIVGNPPYIKKQLLTNQQVEWCNQIHRSSLLSEASINNIWTSFLIRACQLLEDDGILAFILPSELLQVNFSTEMRKLLIKEFDRTEIFTFDDLLFDCKGQDTVLLFGYKKHLSPGRFFSHVKNIQQLNNNEFSLVQNSALINIDVKWSHHWLPASDLVFLKEQALKLQTIGNYCESKPGVVTAANKFFIINEKVESQYQLHPFTRPILQKALYVNGSIIFSKKNLDQLAMQGKPTKVIAIGNDDVLNDNHLEYINIGESQKLQSGHKCSKRKKWYVIPNITNASEGFFFRRSHHYPKLIKNEANVLVTDTAYKVNMKAGYNINSLIYSFYNSLSIIFAELEGRNYGGGVLELTPSEFKKIPVPYVEINEESFRRFAERFERKSDINEILNQNDHHLLHSTLGLSVHEIERIQAIYAKLYNKRFRITDALNSDSMS